MENENPSVKALPENYVAVDLETTGLTPSRDRILEIGAVRVCGGQVQDTFSTFANPGMKIPPGIQELTGITDDMVAEAPTPAKAFANFYEFAGEQLLMGHNLIFDYSFLKQQAINGGVSFERQGIDTLKIARALLPQLESRSLTRLCSYFQIHRAYAHRAFHDALATHELYQHLKKIVPDGGGKVFEPVDLHYRAKKQGPITNAQKGYLNDLVKYHRIELDVDMESLTRSEASRRIDRIISEYGRIKR